MIDKKYTSVEEVLNDVRARQHTKDTVRTANTSENPGGTIQKRTSYSTGIDTTGRKETSSSDGRDRSDETSKRSAYRIDEQSSTGNREFTGSNGGSYQPDRRETRNGNGYQEGIKNAFYNVKSSFKPFAQAFKKDTPQKSETKKVRVAKTLSDAESMKLRPKLVEILLWQSEHADQFIAATTKGHDTVVIWSNMDDAECEIIADFLIDRGKQHAGTATMVRNLSTLMRKIEVGLITLPRAYRTFMTYIERGFSLR